MRSPLSEQDPSKIDNKNNKSPKDKNKNVPSCNSSTQFSLKTFFAYLDKTEDFEIDGCTHEEAKFYETHQKHCQNFENYWAEKCRKIVKSAEIESKDDEDFLMKLG